MRSKNLDTSAIRTTVGPGKLLALMAIGLLLISLGACSRNDDDEAPVVVTPPPVATTVPASALASSRAYTEFTASLVPTETGAALTLPETAAPTSETDAPLPVT